jgi:hypothetical protein
MRAWISTAAMLLLCGGCGHFVDVQAQRQALQSAQPTYSSAAEMSYDRLAFPADIHFSIDEKSPVLDFGDDGKSYVKGFELPARDSEYQLVLRSFPLRDGWQNQALYFPLVAFLDADRKPVQPTDIGRWELVHRALSDEFNQDRWREFRQRVSPNSGIRYMLIRTTRFLVDRGGMVLDRPAAPVEVASAVIVPIFIPSGGPSGPLPTRGSVVGDFRIYLEEIRR